MFTGIVEAMGRIVATRESPAGRRLTIDAGSLAAGLAPGASVCVSGVCLTVALQRDAELEFDVVRETLSRTTLGHKRVADSVNLERSLAVGDRLDGHFVQGHVDGTARVERVITGGERVLWLKPDDALLPYLVPKGSVALDGVSLTLADLRGTSFSVALIPATLERTTLSSVRAGERLNVESDVLARIVAHQLGRSSTADAGVSLTHLREAGLA